MFSSFDSSSDSILLEFDLLNYDFRISSVNVHVKLMSSFVIAHCVKMDISTYKMIIQMVVHVSYTFFNKVLLNIIDYNYY